MNGRIYDPVTARFLTPDPQVQSPTQLHSYNRYSYGFNNPLAGMDPTGYGFWSDLFSDPIGTIVHTVEKVVNSALDNPIKTIATIAVAYFTGIYVGDILGAGSLIGSAAGGFAGGLVGSGGDFKAALIGGITAGAFNWAGGAFGDSPLQLIAAHATIGCASAVASGGSCGAGALSAGFSKVATLGLNDYTTWDALSKGIAVTVIGGTASVLGGGKFENGAVTAAYGYLFNCLAHECLAQGRDAEKTFTDYLRKNADPSLQLGYNRWYDSQDNFFAGRPDIFSESLKMVWDVKPDSYYGWGSGAAQVGLYTAISGYSAGAGAPLFGARDAVTLTGSMNRYEFRSGGGGLVIYRALDASPMERSLGRAFQNQAAPTLSGPPRPRSGFFQ